MYKKISSAQPTFHYLSAIKKDLGKVLETGRLILGPYTKKFEETFARYIDTKYAIAVQSGPAALEISLRYFDVAGKEVLVSAHSFIATVNSIISAGGKPVFVDINSRHYCMDYADMEKKVTPKTKAVVAVHLAGLPVPEIKKIKLYCSKRNIALIEDCSHALGSRIENFSVGSLGDVGCFYFYPTKNITTGTGGMITTNNKKLKDYALSLRHHGVGDSLDTLIHLGYDWLMDEFRAVLGIYQMKDIDEIAEKRYKIGKKYISACSKISGVQVFDPGSSVYAAYFKFLITLDTSIDADKVKEIMRGKGVGVARLYEKPVYQQAVNAGTEALCPVSDYATARQIALPVHQNMTDENIQSVVEILKKSIKVYA